MFIIYCAVCFTLLGWFKTTLNFSAWGRAKKFSGFEILANQGSLSDCYLLHSKRKWFSFSIFSSWFSHAKQILASSSSLGRAQRPVSSLISRQPNLNLARNFLWMKESGFVRYAGVSEKFLNFTNVLSFGFREHSACKVFCCFWLQAVYCLFKVKDKAIFKYFWQTIINKNALDFIIPGIYYALFILAFVP